ncbi:MAG: DUF3450 family protein [Fibrobacteria bacterium]|nr:DUF3450 family protein [Fibrobacteria bacterium]
MIASALVLLAHLLPAQAPAGPATKAQRAELAATQRLRDSLVALRWDARRAAQTERDAWQTEFERVRDSLETVRSERAILDAEALRVARDQQATVARSTPQAESTDPLEPYRRSLQDRARVLRERVAASMPWDREHRLSRVDSLVESMSTAPVNTLLSGLARTWRQEWAFSRSIEGRDTVLPRPEGEPLRGRLLRFGQLGAWYLSEEQGVAGILVRSASEGWRWREDLTDSTIQRMSVAIALPEAPLPFDPGGVPPEGEGFFRVTGGSGHGWMAEVAKLVSFQDGPLNTLARWAARLVMLFLLGLAGMTVWIGVRRHRALSAHEIDEGRYEPHVLEAMAEEGKARELSGKCLQTFAGRLVQRGLAARNLSPEALEQVLSAQESAEGRRLEHGLGLLGTIGSNAPFIGLFGTVCGILDAFAALGRTGGGPQAVMTAIAEALVATAIGLLVAIPAIWLYNSLQLRVQEITARGKELRTLMVGASLEAAARGRKD